MGPISVGRGEGWWYPPRHRPLQVHTICALVMVWRAELALYARPRAALRYNPGAPWSPQMNPAFNGTTTPKVAAVLEVIAIVVVFLATAILILAAARSGDLHVERSQIIRASPRTIFDLIDDLKAWEAWTPYDPAPGMQKTYSGPARGQGATYSWAGNRQAGQSSITITRSVPYSRIAFDLKMVKPFPACNKALFSLIPQPSCTRVIWARDDRTPYAGKVMGLFVNLDRKIGDDLELGLTRLKRVAETAYQPGMNIIDSYIRACIE